MLLIGGLVFSALAASPALAGKAPPPTCWVRPNPVANAGPYTVSGSGFRPGMVVNLYVKDSVSTWIISGWNVPGGTVTTDGTFSMGDIPSAQFYPSDLGEKTVSVVNAYDRRTKTLCQCTFSVR